MNEDFDGDGVSNLLEFQYGLNPQSGETSGGGTNDFQRLFGERRTRYTYDRNDRLVGAEYANGLSIGYVYDGNGNLLRQTHLKPDTNTLPILWRFLTGLTNNSPRESLFGDADGDGWSNYQEWKAGTSPTNRLDVPKPGSAPQTPPIALVLPAGGPVAYRVEIQVGSVSPPRLTTLPFGLDGSFQAIVEGTLGHCTIEASTNLMNWTVVTRLLSTGPQTNFHDPDTTNFNRRFYRVVVP